MKDRFPAAVEKPLETALPRLDNDGMNRRIFILATSAGLAALGLGFAMPSPARANNPVMLRWADLIPPRPVPPDKPARPLVAEGEVDIMEFALRDGPLEDIHADPREPEGRWMSRPGRRLRPPAPVVQSLDGKRVTLGGYVVPLDLEARSVKEFLLVPFVGACVHVPPPPSNQVVHVIASSAFDLSGLFDPVWITGTLTTVSSATELADTGYRLDADSVQRRQPVANPP